MAKGNVFRQLALVGCLIVGTFVAMAYSEKSDPVIHTNNVIHTNDGVVSLSGMLAQDKLFVGSDGKVSLSLTLKAKQLMDAGKGETHHTDMVIVLDQSGSMEGDKITDAKNAVLKLLSSLTPEDRFALVTYSDDVQVLSNLTPLTGANHEALSATVRQIYAGGSTNLSAGLQQGIHVLLSVPQNGNLRRIILISDGLANRGITDSQALGTIASHASENHIVVSTAGVGSDFNEQLMTTLADRGTGRYYYLENPNTFANVFLDEFQQARIAAATGVEIRIPLPNGMTLVDASGYPVEMKGNQAVFRPGDLLSGQTRNLFLTFHVPTGTEASYAIPQISVHYLVKGEPQSVAISEPFTIACVKDPKEAFASIDKTVWEKKVIREDFNRLKEEVAVDIKDGKEQEAMQRIEEYQMRQQAINEVVKSEEVQQNLDVELGSVREMVKDTFSGAPSAVQQKQKENAKSLQYEGYKGRRN